MKKKILWIYLVFAAVLIAGVFAACNKSEKAAFGGVTSLVTTDGYVLCTIKNGGTETDRIAYVANGRNVYSWTAVINGEKVRLINNEELEKTANDEIYAYTFR